MIVMTQKGKFVTYYVPRGKRELLEWFRANKPEYKTSGWTKGRLYAVYHSIRQKGCGINNGMKLTPTEIKRIKKVKKTVVKAKSKATKTVVVKEKKQSRSVKFDIKLIGCIVSFEIKYKVVPKK